MRLWSLLLPLALVVAGCGDKADSTDVTLPGGTGVLPPVDPLAITADSEVGAPVWEVGDHFGHHVFLGPDDTDGTHIEAIVIDTSGNQYTLATNDPEMAKVEAAFDIPILGTISKQDLSTQSFGSLWKVYSFPLAANMTWDGSVTGGEQFNEQVKVQFESSFNAAIDTPYGKYPGFDIVGTTADGLKIIETDYIPAIEWYSSFAYFNVHTEDPEDIAFRSMSMGFGHNWTGTYHLYTGEKLIEIDPAIFADQQGGLRAEPAPYNSFVVSSGATFVYGYAYTWAFGGVSNLRIIDPDGGQHSFQAVAGAEGAGAGTAIDLPAIAGEWRVVAAHGGVATGAGAHLWAVTEGTGVL